MMRRKVDELGRIVLPIEMRKQLQIQDRDDIDIVLENNTIVLSKAIDGCLFCNCAVKLVKLANYDVCSTCRKRLAEAQDGDVLYLTQVD